jgi:hypothetical protein
VGVEKALYAPTSRLDDRQSAVLRRDMSDKLFPTILIILDIGAAAVYAFHKDWARAGYWIAAAAITFFATIM